MDGLSIAMAVAEALLETEAYCLFVTHFQQITSLEHIYPEVRNIHMKGEDDSGGVDAAGLHIVHKLSTGSCGQYSGYGLKMAEKCGLPSTVLKLAAECAEKLKHNHPLVCESGGINKNIAVLNSLLNNLLILENSTLSTAGLRSYLLGLQNKMTPSQFTMLGLVTMDMYQEALRTQSHLEPSRKPIADKNATDIVETDMDTSLKMSENAEKGPSSAVICDNDFNSQQEQQSEPSVAQSLNTQQREPLVQKEQDESSLQSPPAKRLRLGIMVSENMLENIPPINENTTKAQPDIEPDDIYKVATTSVMTMAYAEEDIDITNEDFF